jgi:membrane protein
MSMAESMLPGNVFQLLESTLRDMFIKRPALQLFGILIALYFATNAINVLIVAFNNTYHAIETRSWLERRAIAAFLIIIMFILMVSAISLIIFSRSAINLLDSREIIQKDLTLYIFRIGKWIVIIALIYSALSFLYWLGPSRKMKWKFYSAGSSLASVLVIVTSLIFSGIINHFGQFNRFYGSIGTLMVILLWLYLNSIALLIGFELNASIKGAKGKLDPVLPEEISEDG